MPHRTELDLAHVWRGLLARGAALVSVALVLLAWPHASLRALLLASALSLLLVSAYDVGQALVVRRHLPGWWLFVLRGVAGLALGAVLAVFPIVPAHLTGEVLAVWLLMQGLAMLRLRTGLPAGRRSTLTTLAGLALGLGLAAALWPTPTLLAMLYAAVAYALAAGAIDVIAALRVRAHVAPRASSRGRAAPA